ncbi:hypothetical protein IF2G_03396 [Cordyceps javanica]|nr:hypothetical protein IF2G_03396 [Cordyceps javanica]
MALLPGSSAHSWILSSQNRRVMVELASKTRVIPSLNRGAQREMPAWCVSCRATLAGIGSLPFPTCRCRAEDLALGVLWRGPCRQPRKKFTIQTAG